MYSIFSPVRWRATLFLPHEEHRHGSPRRMGGRLTGPWLITGSNESGLLARGRQVYAAVCHVAFPPKFLSHVFCRILALRSSMKPIATAAAVVVLLYLSDHAWVRGKRVGWTLVSRLSRITRGSSHWTSESRSPRVMKAIVPFVLQVSDEWMVKISLLFSRMRIMNRMSYSFFMRNKLEEKTTN